MVYHKDSETESSLQSRKRKSSSRRSSILKQTKSPTRGPLVDLDPNSQNDTENIADTKKLRRSRRVSFADTFLVKEFVKDVSWQHAAVDIEQETNTQADQEVELINCGGYKKPESTETLETLLTAPFVGGKNAAIYEQHMLNQSDDSLHPHDKKYDGTAEILPKKGIEEARQHSYINQVSVPPVAFCPQQKVLPSMDKCANLHTSVSDSISNLDVTNHADTGNNIAVDKTKLFGPDEDGTMELTACIGCIATNENKIDFKTKSKEKIFFDDGITKVFSADNIDHMELTTCIEGVAVHKGSQPLANNVETESKEHDAYNPVRKVNTKRFLQKLRNIQTGETSNVDEGCTKIFNADDKTGQMDFTRCLAGVGTDTNKVTQNNSFPADSGIKSMFVEGVTKLFNVDDLSHMDFTTCVGGIATDDKSKIPGNFEEKSEEKALNPVGKVNTKSFLQKFARKDVHISSSNSMDTKLTNMADTNNCLEDYAASKAEPSEQCPLDDMDFTVCAGNIVEGLNNGASTHSRAESTWCFTADGDGTQMEFTTCVGQVVATGPKTDNSMNLMDTRNLLHGFNAAGLSTNSRLNHTSFDTQKLLQCTEEKAVSAQGEALTTVVIDTSTKSVSIVDDKTNNVNDSMDTRKLLDGYTFSADSNIHLSADTQKLLCSLRDSTTEGSTKHIQKQTNNLTKLKGEPYNTSIPNNVELVIGDTGDCGPVLTGNAPIPQQSENVLPYIISSKNDNTQHFNSGAGMEFTTCVGKVLGTSVSQTVHQLADDQELLQIPNADLPRHNHTQHFNLGDGMEFTTCTGKVLGSSGNHGLPQLAPKKENPEMPQVSENGLDAGSYKYDSTQHYNSDAGMEFTTTVGNGLRTNVNQAVPQLVDNGLTKIFNTDDKTGQMEFTACIAGVDTDTNKATVCGSFEPESGKQNMFVEGVTKLFNVDDLGHMDLTRCVGGIATDDNKIPDNLEAKSEENVTSKLVFKVDIKSFLQKFACKDDLMSSTNSMDTRKHFEDFPGSSKSMNAADTEKLFNDFGVKKQETNEQCLQEMSKCFDGDDMDFTVCAGKNAEPTHSRAESTRCFTTDGEGARMEFTTCVGQVVTTGSKSDNLMGTRNLLHGFNADSLSTSRSIHSLLDTKKPLQDTEHREETVSTEEDVMIDVIEASAQPECFANDKSNNEEDSSQETSDNCDLTIDPAISVETSDDQDKESSTSLNMEVATFEQERCSDKESILATTFNIVKSESDAVSRDQERKEGLYDGSQDVFNNKDEYHVKTATDEKDDAGILEELELELEPLDFENSMDTKALLAASSSDFDIPKTKSILSQPSGVMSILEVSSVPAEGPWKLGDFLEYIHIQFTNVHACRRSTLAPISMAPLENLSDFLEVAMIIDPELQQYEWACNHLTAKIPKFKTNLTALDARLSENNPKIFDDVKKMDKVQMREFEGQAKSLLKACIKLAKQKMKQWKGKILQSILEAFQQEEADLAKGLKELDDVNLVLDQHLVDVSKINSELTQEIVELENMPLPSKEDIVRLQDWKENVQGKEGELDKAEKERDDLIKQNNVMELANDKLTSELKKIERKISELHASQPITDVLKEKFGLVQRLESYNVWHLAEFDNNTCAQFNFLSNSLLLTLEFGEYIELAESERPIKAVKNIKLVSKLPDGAASWTHLAHRMVSGALGDDLSKLCSTSKQVPKLLTEASACVSAAKELSKEIDGASLWHPVTIDDTTVTFEFSSLEAFAKFMLTLQLVPGQYPHLSITSKCEVLIGDISEAEISDTIQAVSPGYFYITRIIKALDELISRHSKLLESAS